VARKTLSDKGVEALKARASRYAEPDPELAGHYLRVQPSGAKSFVAVTRDPSGKQVWTTIGSPDVLTIAAARVKAREIVKRVRDGKPAIEPKGETFAAVAEEWRARHVRKNGLRSAAEVERLLDRYILPTWKGRPFVEIRRSDVTALLDRVEDEHGPRQADYCLAVVRGLMNWFASRRDDYTPPIARGMRRQSPAARARARVLDDEEIRKVWEAAGQCGTFGGLVKLALLTTQRRDKLAAMRWADVEGGTWTIATEAREKGNAGALELPPLALKIIEAQQQFSDNPHVFAGRGEGPLVGFSKLKARLDRLSGVSDWTLHDLRRTARSLMARAGVRPDIAERVLGHAIAGVEGVYDRHGYRTEKADALAKLAALVDSIVTPRTAEIVPLTRKGKRR
jgi:integrase